MQIACGLKRSLRVVGNAPRLYKNQSMLCLLRTAVLISGMLLLEPAFAQCSGPCSPPPTPPAPVGPAYDTDGGFGVTVSNTMGSYGYTKWDTGATSSVQGLSSTLAVSGLATGTYSFRAKWCYIQDNVCSTNWSQPSAPIYVLRNPDAPSMGESFSANACASSMVVSWSHGSGYPSGSSKYYDLQQSSYNGQFWTDWTNVDSDIGTNSQPVAMTVGNMAELVAYKYRVRSSYQWNGYYSAESGWDEIAGEFVMPQCAPGAVTNLSAAQLNPETSTTSVNITWSPAPILVGSVLGYHVQRRKPTESWPSDHPQNGSYHCNGSGFLSCEFTSLERGQAYEYRVRAYRSTVQGPWSTVNHTVAYATPSAPSAPTFSNVVPYDYTVNWGGGGNGNTGSVTYKLWEKIGAQEGSWTEKGVATSDTFTGEALTVYQYKVQACNGSGVCGAESSVSAISFPGVPGEIATSGIGNAGRNYTLIWSEATGDVSSYELTQSTNGGQSWSIVTNQDGLALSESIVGAIPGVNYQYRVRACNNLACGVYGDVLTYWVPEAPGGLIANPDPAASSFTVTWTAVDQSHLYKLEQSTDGLNWQVAGDTASPAMTLNGLTNGTTYYFRVNSCNVLEECSSYSGSLEAYLPYAAPTMPGALSHNANENNTATGAFTAHWTAPPTINSTIAPITHYRIEYSVNGGSTWQAAPTGGAVPGRVNVTNPSANAPASATFSGLATGAAYSLRVRACNADACGDNTNAYQVYLPRPAPAAPTLIPTNPSQAEYSARQFTVQWTAPATGSVHHYQLEVYAGVNNELETWLSVAETPATAYIFTDRKYGQTYRYRVRACSEQVSATAHCSAWAVTENIRLKYPAPKAPGGISISNLNQSYGSYTLSWNGVLGWAPAYRYELQENRDNAGWQSLTTTLLDPVQKFEISSRTPGTYSYQVRACNPAPDNDCSPWSPQVPPQTPVTVTILPTSTAPGSLSVTDDISPSCTFNLDWTPPSGGQGAYHYELAYEVSGQSTQTWIVLPLSGMPVIPVQVSSRTTLAWTTGTSYNLIVDQANSGKVHTFYVRARTLSNGQYSPWSEWRSQSAATSCGYSSSGSSLRVSAPKFSKTGQYGVGMQYTGTPAPGLRTEYEASSDNGANWSRISTANQLSGGISYGASNARTTGHYQYRMGACTYDISNGYDANPAQCGSTINGGGFNTLTVFTTVLREPGSVGTLQIAGSSNAIDGAYLIPKGQFTLNWSAVSNTGVATVKYETQYKADDEGSNAWMALPEQTTVGKSITLPDSGLPYNFRVRACAYLDEYVNCGSWAQLDYPVKQSMGTPRFPVNTYPSDGKLVVYDHRVPLQWLPPLNTADSVIDHYEISVRSRQTDDEQWVGPDVLSMPAPDTFSEVQNAMVEVEQGGQKEFLIRACGAPSSKSCGAALVFAITVVVPPEAPDEPAGLAGQAHPDPSFGDPFDGALSGEFSVQPSGAAAYTLPIIVPPGSAGMQPEINLSYSSQAGNGIAGQGWSIGGLSMISRCNKTLAQDGEVRGVDYSDNDAYCIDGQRLISIGGGQYRAEKNDFSRISKMTGGACGTWFEVKTQAGQTLQYGYTEDSCHKAWWPWALNKATDIAGNYINYKYVEDLPSTVLTIDRIAYTGNSGNNPYTEVRFHYDTNRPDSMKSYQGGLMGVQTRRLTRITTGVNPGDTSQDPAGYGVYTLNYQADGDEISRLTSIEYCATVDASERCMAPLEFKWTPWQPGWESLAGYNPPMPFFSAYPDNKDLGARMADLDNDGLPDLIYSRTGSRTAYRNTGSGWQPWSVYSPPVDFVDGEGKDLGTQLVDIDGDDLPELLTSIDRGDGSYRVYRNTGSGWQDNASMALPASFARYKDVPFEGMKLDPNSDNGLRMADLDSDGLVDLIRGSLNGDRQAWRNTGNSSGRWQPWPGYAPPVNLTAKRADVTHWPASAPEGFEDKAYDNAAWFADFNGDGLTDLMYKLLPHIKFANENKESIDYKLLLNSGTGWTAGGQFTTQLNYGANGPDAGIRLADLNGDGLPDLMRGNHSGDLIRYNNGSGDYWSLTPFASTPEFQSAVGVNVDDKGVQLLDLNYDGRTDVLLNNHTAWLSTETGWKERPDYRSPESLNAQPGATRFADVNGDGRMDLLASLASSTVQGAWTQRGGPRYITAVSDGLGNKTSVKYKALTDKRPDGRSRPLYTGTANTLDEPHERKVNAPMQVVSQVTVNDGIGGELMTEYAYKGLTSMVGRGLQGFESMTAYKPDGTVATTRYAQRFPYTGLPLEVKVSYGEGSNAPVIERIAHEYCYAVTSEATASNASNPETLSFTSANATCGEYNDRAHSDEAIFVFARQTTAVNKRLSDDLGYVAATVTTITDNTYSAFGHLSHSLATTTGDGHTYTTEVSNLPDGSQADWRWLGRIQESTTTRRVDSTDDGNNTLKTRYEYHANSLLKKKIVEPDAVEPIRLVTAHGYDQYGNTVQTTVCASDFSYCEAGAVNPNANSPGSEPFRTTTTVFDSNGRYPVSLSNALGHTETYAHAHPLGLRTALTGANGLTTALAYDSLGRKISETTPFGTTTFEYRKAAYSGYVPGARYSVQENPPAAAPTRVYYDGKGRKRRTLAQSLHGEYIAADIEYDHFGRVSRETQPYFVYSSTAGDVYWTVNHYDGLGRLQQVQVPLGDIDGDGANDGMAVNSSEYQGLQTIATDNKGRRKLQLQNALGKTVRVVDDLDNKNVAVDYGYDSQGNLTTTIVDGNATTAVTISHNKRGHKTGMTDPDMGHWDYQHNGFGELVWQRDAKQQITEIEYDVLGRMVKRREYPAGGGAAQVSNFTYDSANGAGIGKLHTEQGSAGDTKVYSYTARGQVEQTEYQLDVEGWSQDFTVAQTYDALGRVQLLHYPQVGGQRLTVENRYSPFGGLWYVLDVGDPLDSGDESVYWIAEMVDARGKLLQETLRNQNMINNSFNGATGWLQKVESWDKDLNMIQQTRYGFDSAGNVLYRERFRPWIVSPDGSFQAGENEQVLETFTYDSLDRLLSATVTRDGDVESIKNNDYDVLGNFVYKDQSSNNYVYSGCNAGPHAVCSANGSSFTYDANGNLISSTGTKARTIEYGVSNKPIHITENSSSQVDFVYGADRARVYKRSVAGGRTEVTLYVGLGAEGQPIYEQTAVISGGQIESREHLHFIYAGGYHGGQPFAVRVLQEEEDNNPNQPNLLLYSGTEYYHRDHLGSVIAITGDSGAVQDTRLLSFDAWGKRRNPDWSEGPPEPNVEPTDQYTREGMRGNLAYTGHEAVPEVGLIHMNGRVYDPELGRFLSADPHVQFAEDSQSYNRYSYVHNNPLKYNDPSGYFLRKLLKAISPQFAQIIGFALSFINPAAGAIFNAAWARANGADSATVAFAALVSYAGGKIGAAASNNPFIQAAVSGAFSGAMHARRNGTDISKGIAEGAIQGIAGALLNKGVQKAVAAMQPQTVTGRAGGSPIDDNYRVDNVTGPLRDTPEEAVDDFAKHAEANPEVKRQRHPTNGNSEDLHREMGTRIRTTIMSDGKTKYYFDKVYIGGVDYVVVPLTTDSYAYVHTHPADFADFINVRNAGFSPEDFINFAGARAKLPDLRGYLIAADGAGLRYDTPSKTLPPFQFKPPGTYRP